MARYALINGSKVENVIVLNNINDFQTNLTLVQSDTANIGDIWNGESFSPPPIIESLPPDWGAFIRGLFLNEPYNNIRFNPVDSPEARATRTRLETIGISLGFGGVLSEQDYPLLALLWNTTIQTTVEEFKPSVESVGSWIALGAACYLPVSFNQSTGEMILS
ncbi:hypothetical protein [Nostoc sp. GT001]|uniref:hypothetical protein n=1 Tax=Nostoc sp. GT001 TaxID=3056647 RepID=UPI0025AA7458|nr:hypothetical protein [Nostoc sp. GT001]MDM9583105.1 hypothetical protein [Nostoc sp. GT001]